MIRRLLLALVLLSTAVGAQTIKDNPSSIVFTASVNDADVARYESRVLVAATDVLFAGPTSLGKPTPVSGTITVAINTTGWTQGVEYRVEVRSIGTNGSVSAWVPAARTGRVPVPVSGSGTTRAAADCQLASVTTAVNASADGDTVTIPAGTCSWTGTLSFSKGITLRGAGAINTTDGGAATTGSDQTIILDRHPAAQHTLISVSIPSGKVARITGIKLLMDGSSVGTQAGLIVASGGSNSLRVDHNHFVINPDASVALTVYGLTGVIDHNYFDANLGNGPINIYLQNGTGSGDAAFAAADGFGTDNFIFIEDNRWRNGYLGDANTGGQRFIYRYNTMVMEGTDSVTGYVANHGMTNNRNRSSRALEYYGNVVTSPAPGKNLAPFPFNGGTGLVWGNTVTQYRYVVAIDYTRKNNVTYPYGTPPTGWGNCTGSAGTVWDGPGGYPCLDQPGRGAGDLLSGAFPNVTNARTGTAATVQQALSPIYVWANTFTPAGYSPVAIVTVAAGSMVQNNREVYQQFGTNGEAGTADGTHGIGQGLTAARTSTCTTGVGYWATDAGGNWNARNATAQDGALFLCTSSNVWTQRYTPYAYPHPMTATP